MTTGAPIYLVSACTTGEEFVAAFRRYADRSSLFVPITEPIPSGRRGRFAVTLTGGGVMIEGDGEVISSAKTPSVLHGRIGMTIRFAELDDASKSVLAELEKARLVAKPPAPAAPPRAADVPATPRAKPPAPNARVDAAATLAECVAIGDIEALAASDPKAPPKAGPKFVLPDVLPVGAPRPKTPSTPPAMRPKTPSTPPTGSPRPKTPSIPPAMPSLAPLPGSGGIPKLTASGDSGAIPKPAPGNDSAKMVAAFFADDPAVKGDSGKVATPAKPPPGKSPAMKALAGMTLHGPGVPPTKPVTPSSGAPVVPSSTATPSDGTPLPGSGAPAQIMEAVQVTTTPTQMAAVMPNPTPTSMPIPSATPTAGMGAPTIPSMSAAMPMPTPTGMAAMGAPTIQTMSSVMPTPTPTGMAAMGAPTIQTMSAAMPTPTPQGVAVPIAPVATAPMPTIAPAKPTRDDPTTPSPLRAAAVARREDPTPMSPSRPPPLPGRATPPPLAVVKPPVVADPPAHKMLVADLDETTDLTSPPVARPPSGSQPVVSPSAAPIAADEDLDTGVHAQPLTPPKPVVEEPTPSGDWTIKPGEAGPTIEPRKPATPAPRQTGDWTIQLDADSPDGWTAPAKVKTEPVNEPAPAPTPAPAPVAAKRRPNQQENPPELAPIARSIEIDASRGGHDDSFDSEEPSIQVDPTLLEGVIVDPAKVDAMVAAARAATPVPHEGLAMPQPRTTPMPPALLEAMPPGAALPDPGPTTTPKAFPDASPDPRRSTPLPAAMMMGPPTPVPGTLVDPRVTPLPPNLVAAAAAAPVDPRIATPVPGMLAVSPAQVAAMQVATPVRTLTDGGTGFFKDTGEVGSLSGSYPSHDAVAEARRRRRILVIAISAGLLVVLGVVLVVMMGGGGDKNRDEDRVVTPPPPAAVDAQAVAVVQVDAAEAPPPAADAAVVAPPPKTECVLDITSVPPGAEVVRDTTVLGTTPAKLPLPCGEEVKLTIRKLRFASQFRAVTPTSETTTLRFALQKLMFSIKVSSQPAGANISLNGKAIAMTPTTLKVPALEQSTITFSKEGYIVESFKVTPKQNNQTVHAQLKKKKR